MKKIRIILTSLTLVVAIAGVITAKANEKKRTTQFVGYFIRSGSGGSAVWGSLTGDVDYFDNLSITNQASIKDNGGTNRLIYASQATTTPVKFVP